MSHRPPSLLCRKSNKNRRQSWKGGSLLFPPAERGLRADFRAHLETLEERLALAEPAGACAVNVSALTPNSRYSFLSTHSSQYPSGSIQHVLR